MLKGVKQTFERYGATLALTWSNGETIETTSEHPFYVVGRGFVKAGELGIGTSIVTRAGPSVQLVSAKSGAAQTVYNFEVEEFHTYFVGSGEVWVHNSCPDPFATSIGNGHAFDKHVLQQGEFGGLDIRTKDQFVAHIDHVLKNGINKPLSGGRHAYWDSASSTVVITNPRATDGGTCFQPNINQWPGQSYFDQLT